jgi:hypothetical protein
VIITIYRGKKTHPNNVLAENNAENEIKNFGFASEASSVIIAVLTV